jgi:DNA-binding response OmpR family regulator
MSTEKVIVVEDDDDLRDLLLRGLREEGYTASGAATGAEVLEQLPLRRPDALIVDVGLPDTDGRDLCQALRAAGIDTPVLFLTAHNTLTDRITGLKAGGDDYVGKPFAIAEIMARLEALLRRGSKGGVVEFAGLRLDPAAHAAFVRDERIRLTPTEFRILGRLLAAPGTAVRRHELIRTAWPYGAFVRDNTLDAYIARLRRKLAPHEGAPRIETVHGIGYRLE